MFEELTTPQIADACLRLGLPVRCAPDEIRPLGHAMGRMIGPARPVRHYGSVDVFLELLETSSKGDVLVVDNAGRRDEACVGDLVALEAKNAGLAGIVIWGLVRDVPEILEIGIPIFSLGTTPVGPVRLDPRESDATSFARIGASTVTGEDVVVSDGNGVVFVPRSKASEIATAARFLREKERNQAAEMHQGKSLRQQLQFANFLHHRSIDPKLSFRQHLRQIGGAVEE